MIDRLIEIAILLIDIGILWVVRRGIRIEQKSWDYNYDIKLLSRLVNAVEKIEKRLRRRKKKRNV